MAEISNLNYKRFLTQFNQAKNSGSSEMRIPIKQAEDLILELSMIMSDRLVNTPNKESETTEGFSSNSTSDIVLSGGGFKK